MLISDWSSDLCSSDLRKRGGTATLKSSAPSATATAWFARPPRGSTPTTKTFETGRKHEDYRKNSSRGPAPARHPVHRADQQRLRCGRRLRPHLRGRLGRHPPGLVEISDALRSEEHTSELQSLMRLSY